MLFLYLYPQSLSETNKPCQLFKFISSLSLFFCSKKKKRKEMEKMALRPIDNALPITPERLKKHVKVVSAPIQKQSEFGVNDENKAPLPPSSTIDYVSSEDLKPVSDPVSMIQVSLSSFFFTWFFFFCFFIKRFNF